MYTYAATALVSASLAFGGAWRVQDWRYKSKEAENESIRAAEGFAAGNAAKGQIQNVSNAQSAATRRDASLRRAAADSADQLRLLHEASAAALRTAATSLDACTERAATFSRLLDHCGQDYQDLGERADRHVSDIRTLMDAWPK
jgi:hypothetical protein